VIDTEELLVVLRALGSEPKKAEIKTLVGDVDKDGTGQVDFDGCGGFLALALPRPV
jgi:centrin-1